jgi:hypothetical protein
MLLLDANVLIYAFRRDLVQHAKAKRWVEKKLAEREPLGLHEFTELAFLRITTNPRAFAQPSSLEESLSFLNAIRACPLVTEVRTAPGHRETFIRLCRDLRLAGNDITDAFIAAVAIEAEATLASADSGFARFHDLQWIDPLNEQAA